MNGKDERMTAPLTGDAIAQRSAGSVTVRTSPMLIRWSLGGFRTLDGHDLSISLSCRIAGVDQPTDRAMLAETLLAGRNAATVSDAADYFAPRLRGGIDTETAGVDHWVGDVGVAQLRESLRQTLATAGFSAGVEFLGPFDVVVTSTSLEKARAEARRRERSEQEAAQRIAGIRRAGEMAAALRSALAEHPSSTAGSLIAQMPAADRAAAVAATMLGERPVADFSLVALCGRGMVRIHGEPSSPACAGLPLDMTLGPCRSLSLGHGADMLIGARDGVLVMKDHVVTALLREGRTTSRYGFTRAIASDRRVIATHREYGLVVWDLAPAAGEGPSAPPTDLKPMVAFRPTDLGNRPPENVVCLPGGRVVFSAGDALWTFDQSVAAMDTTPGSIANVLAFGDELIVVGERGWVQIRCARGLDCLRTIELTGGDTLDIRAAALVPWMGSYRVALLTSAGTLLCMGPDDRVLTPYLAGASLSAIVASGSGLIAAASDDRQRVVLWALGEPMRPAAIVQVAAQTRSSLVDLAFLPAP